MAGEHKFYTPGSTSAAIDYKGWKILPRICYDLRFPVWNRSTAVDLQIYVANWPQPRIQAWDTLLKARAIENQCYVVGSNRVGVDANGNNYVGHSAVIDAKGLPVTPENNETEGWIYAELDKQALSDFRERFPFYRDADGFSLDHSLG
jgi:predicted amidohydrolase